jgi:hypothetical protein
VVHILFARDLLFIDPDDNKPLEEVCRFYKNDVNFVYQAGGIVAEPVQHFFVLPEAAIFFSVHLGPTIFHVTKPTSIATTVLIAFCKTTGTGNKIFSSPPGTGITENHHFLRLRPRIRF